MIDKKRQNSRDRPTNNVNRTPEVNYELLNARSVYSVTAGGKVRNFSTAVVVKSEVNGRNYIGIGKGSARQFGDAVKKAVSFAKKRLVLLKMNKHKTIYHSEMASFHGTKILLIPAKEGSGIKAAPVAKKILSYAGYRDITCSILTGSKCPLNIAGALMKGLSKIESISEIANRLNTTVDKILYRKMCLSASRETASAK